MRPRRPPTYFPTHETARYCRRRISPSPTSFVRLFDSAEVVYSTSSASEPGSSLHPTPSLPTARHGLKRLHHGSAAVAQASRRVWMDDFRRDRPLNRPLASRSRCLANRSIRPSGSIVGSAAVYAIIHLLLAETGSENRRSFTALTTEEAPAAGPCPKPFRTRSAIHCWI